MRIQILIGMIQNRERKRTKKSLFFTALVFFVRYLIQHPFIRRPLNRWGLGEFGKTNWYGGEMGGGGEVRKSDTRSEGCVRDKFSTSSRTVATCAMAIRRSNQSSISLPKNN
jgi:hypothetical protein